MPQKISYEPYFPFSDIRPAQKKSLDFVLENINSKRFFILELPTGVGKSAIALCLSKWIQDNFQSEVNKGSYIITTQKVLQQQYIDDFSEISNIWSKSNYSCMHRRGMSCEESQILASIFSSQTASKQCKEHCRYNHAYRNFMGNPIGVTNIAYMLTRIENWNQNDKTHLYRRQLLVVDECHNLEQSIVDFVANKISKSHCEEDLKIDYPEDIENIESAYKWIKNIYQPRLRKVIDGLMDKIYKLKKTSKKTQNNVKDLISYERREYKVFKFIDKFHPEDWVIHLDNDFFEIKPIYAYKFTNRQLFNIADKVLLMSGTILDKNTFCNHIGIKKEDACFISLPSPFKTENRPVFIMPYISMSHKDIDMSLPQLNGTIQEIISKYHSEEKGIIHTHTYKTAKYLKDNDISERMQIHDSRNRMNIYQNHLSSKDNRILVSPSFTEGIDLIDNFSRFQIICKIPFPYLGDEYIREKMARCKYWYEWMTAKTLIQSLGRSVRSEEDHAVSYILDKNWNFFYKRNKFLFPKWFTDSLIIV